MQILNTIKTKLNITDKDIENASSFIKSKSQAALAKTQEQLGKSYEIAHDKTLEAIDDYKKTKEPLSDMNWYTRAATACEDVSDAILREDKGTSTKITKSVAGKLGAAGTSVGIFSIASILGTASTGTAIGSLSGAAFTSSALAWVGGSMMMGSIIIGVASIAGGIGAVLGAGWVYKKYLYGEKREKSELELKEQNIIDVCLSLATGFHQKAKEGQPIDPITAQALYADALQPLCEDLLSYKLESESWTTLSKKRFHDAVGLLRNITDYLHAFSIKHPNATIGITSAVILQLLSDDIYSFTDNEELVLEALRRSNNELTNATVEELSEYIQDLEPSQIPGLHSNIKGIYHEIRYAYEENTDGDEYIIELFTATNHAGADVRIINTITGDIREVQLKATEYLSYIKKHNERYEDIEVFATSEVSGLSDDITSTNISLEEINHDVTTVINKLDNTTDTGVISSMTVAAMIVLAKNSRVLLRGDSISVEQKSEMIRDGSIAAGTAAIVSLLIG
jgi:hypothetical protein